MNRKETVELLISVGQKLASDMGYSKVTIKANALKDSVIWGSNFLPFLQKKYDDRLDNVIFVKPDAPDDFSYGDNIEIRYRFSNPCICIDHRAVDGSMAEIEFSDFYHANYAAYAAELGKLESDGEKLSYAELDELTKKFHVYTGNYIVSQKSVFEGDNAKGSACLQVLMDLLAEMRPVCCTKTEIIDKVVADYRKYDTELSGEFFDFQVRATEADILEAYAYLQEMINGDYVTRLSDIKISYDTDSDIYVATGHECELVSPEQRSAVYEGNCKAFLESFNGCDREMETGLCRFIDGDEEDGIISGNILDFVF